MLLAVGGESRRIVLGEVPPAKAEQEQEPAQDVAAQWRHPEGPQGSFPIPQPRQRTGNKGPEARARGLGNQMSLDSANIKDNEGITPKSRRGTSEIDHSAMKQPRKLIPVDFDLKLDVEEDEDDDDDDDEEYTVTRFEDKDEVTNVWESKEAYRSRVGTRAGGCCDLEDEDEDKSSANPWRKTGGLRLTQNEYHRFCDTQLECKY